MFYFVLETKKCWLLQRVQLLIWDVEAHEMGVFSIPVHSFHKVFNLVNFIKVNELFRLMIKYMNCEILWYFPLHFKMSLVIAPPPLSVIMTYWLRKSIYCSLLISLLIDLMLVFILFLKTLVQFGHLYSIILQDYLK